MSFKYEIGDRFKTTYSTYEVVGRTIDGCDLPYYWLADEFGSPGTYRENFLDGCTKVQPFFEVGDTFELYEQEGRVLFVTEESDKPSALVLYVNEFGHKWTENVTDFTYSSAENIKHNKS